MMLQCHNNNVDNNVTYIVRGYNIITIMIVNNIESGCNKNYSKYTETIHIASTLKVLTKWGS